jgi:hypothetical protein
MDDTESVAPGIDVFVSENFITADIDIPLNLGFLQLQR